jgi:glycosyltransferase involved in cell wall biosynthesis
MRVLYVTSQWPRDEAGRHVAPFVGREVQSLRDRGVDVDVLPYAGGWSVAAYVRAARALHAALARRPYDLVHARFGQCGLVGRAQLRLPLVVTFGGSDLEGIPFLRGLRRYRHHLLRLASRLASLGADQVIVVSGHLGPLQLKRSYHVIPAGVDLDLFRPMDRGEARIELGLPNLGRFVLFVGDPANPRKRHALAREACAIAGRSTEVGLLTVCREAPRRVALHMNAADVLVLTSTNEGSPNVVKEALACNLPVVSVDVGDVRERLTGLACCEVVADETPESIAAALLRAIHCDERPALRESVMQLGTTETARRIIGVYEQALAGRGR